MYEESTKRNDEKKRKRKEEKNKTGCKTTSRIIIAKVKKIYHRRTFIKESKGY